MMKVQVHLLQRLLHVLNLRCSGRNQVKAMALETTQPADHVLGPERSTQQPKTVQSLDPLAVLDVSLTSRDVAQMPSIDQKHFDAGRFQLLVERYPVDPRCLHSHGGDPAVFQPLDQSIQSLGESAEAAHKRLTLLYRLRRHSGVMLFGSTINTARMPIDYLHLLRGLHGFGYFSALFRRP